MRWREQILKRQSSNRLKKLYHINVSKLSLEICNIPEAYISFSLAHASVITFHNKRRSVSDDSSNNKKIVTKLIAGEGLYICLFCYFIYQRPGVRALEHHNLALYANMYNHKSSKSVLNSILCI